jgi:hypothetical protein
MSYAPSTPGEPWLMGAESGSVGSGTFGFAAEAPPEVHRSPPVPQSYRRDGLYESLPFLLLGLGLLGAGIWSLSAKPLPTSPVPLWILLFGSGAIALAGGFAAALAAPARNAGPPSSAREPPPRAIPRDNVRPSTFPETDAAYERAPTPAIDPSTRAPPVLARPSVAVPPEPARTVARPAPARARPLASPLPSSPGSAPGTTHPRVPQEIPEEDGRAELESEDDPDAVARDLDDLAELVRGHRRRDASPPSPAAEGRSDRTPDPRCHGCERSIAPTEPSKECASCARPLCGECLAAADREGRPGLCPICGLIEGPRRPRARE